MQTIRIPEWADKWIFFIVMVTLGAIQLVRSTGLSLGIIGWVLLPLLFGVIGLIPYLIVRAFCRVTGRLLGRDRHVRVFTNSTFVMLIVISMLPILPGMKVTVDLPHKITLHTQ